MGNNPDYLDPRLREKYDALSSWAEKNGTPFTLESSYRTQEEQEALRQAYGGTRPVARRSAHSCTDDKGNPSAKAFDIKFPGYSFGQVNSADRNGNKIPDIQEIAGKAKELGLEWMGSSDPVHFQLANWRKECGKPVNYQYTPPTPSPVQPGEKPQKPAPKEPPPAPKPRPKPKSETKPQPIPEPKDACGRGKTRYNDIAIMCVPGRLVVTYSPDHITNARKDIRIRDLGRLSCPNGCTLFIVITSSRKKIINARKATRRRDRTVCFCGHHGAVVTSSRDSFLK